MALFNNKYRIESNRWEFWDYSAPAAYFITICTVNREHSFGKITKQEMELSEVGKIVEKHIKMLFQYHKRVILDEWVIMPNHIHLIITLAEMDFDNAHLWNIDTKAQIDSSYIVEKIHEFSPTPIYLRETITENDIKAYRKKRRRMLIPMIIGKFKMQISKEMNLLNGTPERSNWQENYHDHVIRSVFSYKTIKEYIVTNPENWKGDMFFGETDLSL